MLYALLVGLIVAGLWRYLEPSPFGTVVSWTVVYATILIGALLLSAGFGYAAWLVLRAI